MIIYKVTNKINGKVYIGQTTRTLRKREQGHWCSKKGKIGAALEEFGRHQFQWEVIYKCLSKDELDEMECFYIKYYNSIEDGYNTCKGGGDYPTSKGENHPMYGRVHSEESRKKISDNHHNVSGENNPMYGVIGNNNPRSGRYIITDPDGREHTIVGLRQFCLENNLNYIRMCEVVMGKQKKHKGWTVVKC